MKWDASDPHHITLMYADGDPNVEQHKNKFILSNYQYMKSRSKKTYYRHSTSGRPRKVSGSVDGSPCLEPHVTSASVPSLTVLLQVLQLLRFPISLEYQKWVMHICVYYYIIQRLMRSTNYIIVQKCYSTNESAHQNLFLKQLPQLNRYVITCT